MTARVTANMWEVVAAPGKSDALVDWVYTRALPELAQQSALERSEVFLGSGDRVVVITLWRGEPMALSDPPGEYVARPAMSWDFEQVAR